MKIYLVLYVLLSSLYFVFGFDCTSKDEDLAEGCALAPTFGKNDSFPINKATNGDIFMTFYLKVQSHARVLLIEKPTDSKSNENKVTIDITTNGFNISLPNGSEKYYQENYVVSPVEWREFWVRISTVHGWIKIGKGGNDTEFVSSNYPNGFHVHYYAVVGFNASFIHGCLNHTVETMRNRIDQYNVNTLKCALHSKSNHKVPPKITSENKIRMNFTDVFNSEVFQAEYDWSLFSSNIKTSVHGQIKMAWKDERLAWTPKQQYDRTSVELSIDSIWKPTIKTKFGLNTKTYAKEYYFMRDDAHVSYDGTVSWTIFVNEYMSKSLDPHTIPTCTLNMEVNFPFEIYIPQNHKPFRPSYVTHWKTKQILITYQEPTTASHTSWQATINATFQNVQSGDETWLQIYNTWDYSTSPKTPVSLTCILESRYIDLNTEEGIFELIGNASIFWKDDRQSWSTEIFTNMSSFTTILYYTVLRPEMTLRNDPSLPQYELLKWNTKANVSSNGQVFVEKDLNIRTRCSNIDSRSWPWDVQKCRIDFKTVTNDTSPVTLIFIDKTDDDYPTTKWEVVKSEVVTSQRFTSIEFTLREKSSSLKTAIRSIYVVIGTITLLSFWLSPWHSWKMAAKRFSILMLVLFLIFLMCSVPKFTTVAFNFLIGYVTLIFIVTWSTCLSIRFINSARKEYSSLSHVFVRNFVNHPIVQAILCLCIDMRFVDQDVTERAMDTLKSGTVERSNRVNDSKAFANHMKQFFQKDWLKVAVISERLFFLISLPIVLYLGVGLMF